MSARQHTKTENNNPKKQAENIMATSKIHIFRAGTFFSMGGQSVTFSESDLASTAAAYNPRKHIAPLVLGHPEIDAPAYGSVNSLSMLGSGLYAFADVGPVLQNKVRSGEYLRVSASFYPPYSPHNPVPGIHYLKHVGFLGAVPPAVKGLEPPAFASSHDGCLSFAAYALPLDMYQYMSGDRDSLHARVLEERRCSPNLSYAEALGRVESKSKAATQFSELNVEPERLLQHRQILGIQAASPGMSYAEAANIFFRR